MPSSKTTSPPFCKKDVKKRGKHFLQLAATKVTLKLKGHFSRHFIKLKCFLKYLTIYKEFMVGAPGFEPGIRLPKKGFTAV